MYLLHFPGCFYEWKKRTTLDPGGAGIGAQNTGRTLCSRTWPAWYHKHQCNLLFWWCTAHCCHEAHTMSLHLFMMCFTQCLLAGLQWHCMTQVQCCPAQIQCVKHWQVSTVMHRDIGCTPTAALNTFWAAKLAAGSSWKGQMVPRPHTAQCQALMLLSTQQYSGSLWFGDIPKCSRWKWKDGVCSLPPAADKPDKNECEINAPMEKGCHSKQQLQLSLCQVGGWNWIHGEVRSTGRNRQLEFLLHVIMVQSGPVWQCSEPCPAARLQGHLNYCTHRNYQQLPEQLV